MSWGFFLYVVWFNPGQSFEFYAQLQRWPMLLLAQDVAACIAQAAGYAGLLLFAIRAPADELQPEWARVERALPLLALVIAVALDGLLRQRVRFQDRNPDTRDDPDWTCRQPLGVRNSDAATPLADAER